MATQFASVRERRDVDRASLAEIARLVLTHSTDGGVMFNIGLMELIILIVLLLIPAMVIWLIVRATRTSRQANRALIEMNERQERAEQGGPPSA